MNRRSARLASSPIRCCRRCASRANWRCPCTLGSLSPCSRSVQRSCISTRPRPCLSSPRLLPQRGLSKKLRVSDRLSQQHWHAWQKRSEVRTRSGWPMSVIQCIRLDEPLSVATALIIRFTHIGPHGGRCRGSASRCLHVRCGAWWERPSSAS
eukprot:6214681-Pleurochrysis_carterae.AAC.1